MRAGPFDRLRTAPVEARQVCPSTSSGHIEELRAHLAAQRATRTAAAFLMRAELVEARALRQAQGTD
jgi:hypothetical protein